MEKKICCNCGIEKSIDNYYQSRSCNQSETMDICKDCFIEEIRYNPEYVIFKRYNIPFICDLYHSINLSYSRDDLIKEYMRLINLPQYKNLTWQDSILNKEQNKNELNFYDNIVLNLKQEAQKLNERLARTRELVFNNPKITMNDYISTLKALRETLDLISKFDSEKECKPSEVKMIFSDEFNKEITNKVMDRIKQEFNKAGLITRTNGISIGNSLKSVENNINKDK